MAGIIYKDDSYRLMRILFDVQNDLGPSYQEKHYQRAIERKLQDAGIPYEREKSITVTYKNGSIGEFFIDFVIDGKIILEVKHSKFITREDRKQLLQYLKATRLKLGILANFGRKNKLQYARIINL